jgi:hypothetical protein
MTKRIKHIGSLLGRVFLLSQYNDVSSAGADSSKKQKKRYCSMKSIDFIGYCERLRRVQLQC